VIQLASIIFSHATSESDQTRQVNKNTQLLMDGFITWDAFFLPKGTPAPIIKKLHDATAAAMDTPSVQERLLTIGATVVTPERRSPEYLRSFQKSEIEKWAAPIRASGASLD